MSPSNYQIPRKSGGIRLIITMSGSGLIVVGVPAGMTETTDGLSIVGYEDPKFAGVKTE